jgi:hypothetical protein
MTLELFNSTLLVLGFGILSYFVKNALPAYFTEKGKNLATKEDIEGITRQVESIKNEFTNKTEKLKTELQYSNQVRFSIKTEERSAIINLHEKYFRFYGLLTNIQFGHYADVAKGKDNITLKIDKIEEAYGEILLAEAKMRLYVKDKQYVNDFSNLKRITINLTAVVRNDAAEYWLRIFPLLELITKTTKKDEEADGGELTKKINTKIVEFVKRHSSNKNEILEEITAAAIVWERSCSAKITELSNEIASQ